MAEQHHPFGNVGFYQNPLCMPELRQVLSLQSEADIISPASESLINASMSQDISELSVSIETITPEIAAEYLKVNFEKNRKPSKQKISEYAQQMKNGEWFIGDSCICFDRHMKLVNGQHRLEAQTKAQMTLSYVVLRGLDDKCATIMDIGRKRTASERLTIGNKESITSQELATIRNALIDYSFGSLGHEYYNSPARLQYCYAVYERHSDFISEICKKYSKVNSFYRAAALKIFAQMKHDEKQYNNNRRPKPMYAHNQTPHQRATAFLSLMAERYPEDYEFNRETDNAATLAYAIQEKAASEKSKLRDKDTLNKIMCLAHKFMLGVKAQRLNGAYANDPFVSFAKMEPTNDPF